MDGDRRDPDGFSGPANWLRRYWLRLGVNVAALVPLLLLVWWLATDRFFLDPVKQITIRTGRLAITFLLLSLACTPLASLTGVPRIRRARRPFGLWSLAYTTLHFLTFAGWDYRFDPALLRIGIFSQPFVLVGMGAFLILLVLGVTSWPRLQRSMGRSWRRVQRGVYVAAVLDVWHVLWLKKSVWEAWRYPAILAVLFILRIPQIRKGVEGLRTLLLEKGNQDQRA
ncbi:MAG: sulfoxide reductase heme-binding subunit YedZ [Anaerolineae bacterium]|nr:sulfoxide reductase heme-binding subunit YedZ [Anaerolineae bacterium]